MRTILVGVLTVCLLVVGRDVMFRSSAGPTEAAASVLQSGPTPNPPATLQSSTVTGSYIDYKPGIIEQTAGTKLLFFHASWCPQCRALEADIRRNTIPANTTIIKVDYDSNQALRQKYGVTIQTTVVHVDDRGNLVKKYVAYESPTLAAVIKNLL